MRSQKEHNTESTHLTGMHYYLSGLYNSYYHSNIRRDVPYDNNPDLSYLQVMYVIVSEGKLVQLSFSPLQIFNLLLQLLQPFFSSTHCILFLISDHLCHLRSAFLDKVDQFSKDLLTVLHC